MKRNSTSFVAIACAGLGSLVLVQVVLACDTPPVSPAEVGAPTIPPAHASPDPPPGRPVIIDESDARAARGDGAMDGAAGGSGSGGGALDGSASASDGGASASDGGAELGPRPVPDAAAVIATLRPKFRACYTRSNIRARPKGSLVLTATVAADGSVVSVTPSQVASIGDRVVTCMVDVLKKAHFSAPGGSGSTLDVPVTFHSP